MKTAREHTQPTAQPAHDSVTNPVQILSLFLQGSKSNDSENENNRCSDFEENDRMDLQQLDKQQQQQPNRQAAAEAAPENWRFSSATTTAHHHLIVVSQSSNQRK